MPRKKKEPTTIDKDKLKQLAKKIFIKRKLKEIGKFFGWVGLVFVGIMVSYFVGTFIMVSENVECGEKACPFWMIASTQTMVGLCVTGFAIAGIVLIVILVKNLFEYIVDWISSNWKASLEEASKQLGGKQDD